MYSVGYALINGIVSIYIFVLTAANNFPDINLMLRKMGLFFYLPYPLPVVIPQAG